MNKRRSRLERAIQAEIELALGAEPDLLLMRNPIGDAIHYNDVGEVRSRTKFGLGEGSPDLVGILRARIERPSEGSEMFDVGVWFAIEVKADEGELSDEQIKAHRVWRSFGALIYTARSVGDAHAALEHARRLIA